MKFKILMRGVESALADTFNENVRDLTEDELQQFFIGQDGMLVVLDKTGQAKTCDRNVIVQRTDGICPDIEFMKNDFVAQVKRLRPELFRESVGYEVVFETFSQVWASTAGGFEEPGMMAGSAMTRQYTTIFTLQFLMPPTVDEKVVYGVYFGDRPAYLVEDPTDEFFADWKNHSMFSQYGSRTRY